MYWGICTSRDWKDFWWPAVRGRDPSGAGPSHCSMRTWRLVRTEARVGLKRSSTVLYERERWWRVRGTGGEDLM